MDYSSFRALAISVLTLIIAVETTYADQSSLSEQCTSENLALASNQALLAVAPTIKCNIQAEFMDSCTADFADQSDQFRDVCLDVGGQYFTTDVILDCTVTASGVTYNADYNFLNYPACVGASCTVSEIKAEFENVIIPAFEQSLASDGFTCQGDTDNEMITYEGDLKPNNDNGTSDAGSRILNLKNIGYIYSLVGLMVASITVIAM